MNAMKALGGIGLLVLIGTVLLTVATLAGAGVESQLVGSEWQLAGLATGVFTLLALAALAALGQPWRSARTTYW